MASPARQGLLPPETLSQLDDIARNDESKGAVVHSFDPDASPQEKAAAAGKSRDQLKSVVAKQDSPSTAQELSLDTGSTGVVPTITVEDVDNKVLPQNHQTSPKPEPALPGSFNTPPAPTIPDWYKVGWRAVGDVDAPKLEGLEKDLSALGSFLHEQFYGYWYHNAALVFFAVFSSHFLTRFNFGWGWLLIVLATCNTYYVTSMARVRARARDDIQRELIKTGMVSEHETAEWLNNFLERFWRIYEPVLSTTIVSTVDQILSTNCPPFLESLRLGTFTLGNKSIRIDKVRTFPKTEEDVVVMDWGVSFTPNDISDMTPNQVRMKVNPKIVLSVRLGKGFATASMPVLLEDLSFSGLMRVRMKLMANFPHVQLVELSFLERPKFDYSLKPIGGESFGIDVANIPGLSSFIQEMVHATLSPMMYDPNSFKLNLQQLLSGAPLDTAIGVLRVLVHSARGIKGTKIGGGTPDPYVSLCLNNRAELAKTKHKHNTYNPTWMETKFLLVNSLSESLVLGLYDYNDHRSNTLLGSASFDLAMLLDDASQEDISRTILKDGKERGEMRFDVSFYPVLEANADSAQELPKTNVGVVRLVVHQAKELDPAKSVSGNSSPLVKIYLGVEDTLIHTSNRVKHTNNPVWESAAEFLCTDRQSSVITIKVVDDKSLGYITVPLESLLQAQKEMGEVWWPLSGCQSGRIRLSTEWKPLEMAGSIHGAEQYVPPIGVVRLWLQKATDVKNVEASLGGRSDPYVRVQINNITLGRTEVVNNNLNPVWDQIIYTPVHSLKETLFLECMDYQNLTKDRSLGSVELHLTELASPTDAIDYPYKSTGKKVGTDPIRLDKKNSFKGQLHYEVEFIPAVALNGVKFETNGDKIQQTVRQRTFDSGTDSGSDGSSISSSDVEQQVVSSGITATAPLVMNRNGYHQHQKSTDTTTSNNSATDAGIAKHDSPPTSPISATSLISAKESKEEQGVDMSKDQIMQQQSGIIVVNVIGGQLSRKARLEVLLDDGYWPVFSTTMARSTNYSWGYIGEGFIKELDFGRIWFRLNVADDGDKDDIIGEYQEDVKKFLEQALDGSTSRTLLDQEDKPIGTVQLEARYIPVPVKLEPRETINNQGTLNVDLMDGRDITGVDRSGKSDPFAVFTLNGQRVFKSQTKKHTLTPEWNEKFEVSVPSRVGANFEVEVFDWNQIEQAKSLGVARIELADLEPFQGIERIVSLSTEKQGEKGKVRMRLNFQPKIIIKSRKSTSTFSAAGRAMTQIGALPVGAGKGVFHGVAGVFKKGRNESQEELVHHAAPDLPSGQPSQPVANGTGSTIPISPSVNAVHLQNGQDTELGRLKVSVVDAKGFNPAGESVKPYVLLRCGDKEHKIKHAPKSSTSECSWNESFSFVAGPSTQPKIYVWLYDHKTLAKDKQLGAGEIDIWHHIHHRGPCSADVVVELGEGQGSLTIRLAYDPDDHALTRKASNSSNERLQLSPSRFSIRARRPGGPNDD